MHRTKFTPSTVLFFDLDGTLVDTNLANFLSYQKAIRALTKSDYDIKYDPDKRFNRNCLKKAVHGLTEPEYNRIIELKGEHYTDFLAETRLNKPLADILLKYSKSNTTILVTNCRQDRALKTLDYHGLTNQFSKLFFNRSRVNGATSHKYKNAISELGVPPKFIVAFENEKIEIAHAKQAGIRIINPEII